MELYVELVIMNHGASKATTSYQRFIVENESKVHRAISNWFVDTKTWCVLESYKISARLDGSCDTVDCKTVYYPNIKAKEVTYSPDCKTIINIVPATFIF